LRSPEAAAKLPTPTQLIDTVRSIVKDKGLTLIIEPGRSMVATSSALVNTVTGVKVRARDNDYAHFVCLSWRSKQRIARLRAFAHP
jgi:diaminopimelate decarboxylase